MGLPCGALYFVLGIGHSNDAAKKKSDSQNLLPGVFVLVHVDRLCQDLHVSGHGRPSASEASDAFLKRACLA